MQTALALFIHALRMVFRNPAGTLRATWPGLVFLFLGSIGVLWSAATSEFDTSTFEPAGPVNWPAVSLMLVGYLLGSAITAIFWHRYVLLDDPHTPGPSLSAGMVLSYLWRVIKIALVTILCLIPAIIVVLAFTTTSDQFTPFQSALSILLNWLGTYLLYRFALGLPGVCIGDDIGITDSFRHTKLLAIPLLWLTALSGVLTAIITWVGQLVPAPAQFGLLLDTGLFFIQALIGASILTALYGHLVQNRALPGIPAKAL